MPGFSNYHTLSVVKLIIMGIRKAIAAQLSNAAKALENDKSKEKTAKLIIGVRIGLANAIMPKIPLAK